MENFKETAKTLISTGLHDLHDCTYELVTKLGSKHPPLPIPRSPTRYLTRRLAVRMNVPAIIRFRACKVDEGLGYIEYVDFTKTGWKTHVSQETFIRLLVEECTTPRRLCRVVTRIEYFSAWMHLRKLGLQISEENFLRDQQPWIEKLNARIGVLDLAETPF